MQAKALSLSVVALAVGSAVCAQPSENIMRSRCASAEAEIYYARQAELKADTASAAQHYTNAISFIESAAPRTIDLSKLVLCDETVSSIGRRMVYYRIKLFNEELAKTEPTFDTRSLLKDLDGAYGKMAWIERNNPTWPYLQAVSDAANGDYRTAFQECREAATKGGGQDSVKQKAKSLAEHIKQAALQQEEMKAEDRRQYEQYVRSGAQALDFAMISAQYSADDARKRGDMANASMWDSRYKELQQKRSEMR